MLVKTKALDKLTLEDYLGNLKYSQRDGKKTIFDPIRKRYFIFTPEELTRQLIIQHFLVKIEWPQNLISIEKEFSLYRRKRRYDLVFYKDANTPAILVECKAPNINLSNTTFEQVANYNLALKVPYLLVSNCRESFFFAMDFEEKRFNALESIGLYTDY